ncbi:hypothetical protein I350_05072 [Cryptococcus amylolentus CBS 6273]|uniref:HMG box domain-containing protein n=1 Tax=Cryptococcus amylolentus CBS 6273 TaxID=1296118 RepID=A0A1E3JYZ0_9TREE|nr:hypothetical protein I350_05072 [Cryptococcus amylolentus CBS 6273]
MLTAAADKKEVKKAAPKQKREKMDPNKPKQSVSPPPIFPIPIPDPFPSLTHQLTSYTRALSAYMFFDQDNRERIMAEYPGATFDHVGKLLGLRWKEMSDSEKEPYYKKAAADITRAEKDSAAYKADSHP